ncbi:MAG: hypothetical protein WCA04_05090 [Geobacteraceae bacterium]
MNRLVTAIFIIIYLTIYVSPAHCAERSTLRATRQTLPAMEQEKTTTKPAISELSLLRNQVSSLRQDLEKEKAAREKLQTEMQNKIEFLVGLLNLTSQKVTNLENHTHEYSSAPFGYITKKGFGNIPDDALIPYVRQENVGKGVRPTTGPPLK